MKTLVLSLFATLTLTPLPVLAQRYTPICYGINSDGSMVDLTALCTDGNPEPSAQSLPAPPPPAQSSATRQEAWETLTLMNYANAVTYCDEKASGKSEREARQIALEAEREIMPANYSELLSLVSREALVQDRVEVTKEQCQERGVEPGYG